MKHFLTLFLACMGLFCQAQELVLDTTYFQWDGAVGAFFEVFDQQFDDGSQNFTRKHIGDTTQTKQYIFASYVNASQQVGGTAASYIVNRPIISARNNSLSASFEQITGGVWNVEISNYFADQYLGSYRLFINGANQGDFDIIQLGNGLLRLALTSNPGGTFYPVRVESQNTVRLLNLPTVGNVMLYLVGKNNLGRNLFIDVGKQVRLVRLN